MFINTKQIICKILSFCLLLSSFCIGDAKTSSFSVLKNKNGNRTLLADSLKNHEDIYLHQSIKEAGRNLSDQLYSKKRKSGSDNKNVILLGFDINSITSLFILFFILNRISLVDTDLSIANILNFIQNKDGKK